MTTIDLWTEVPDQGHLYDIAWTHGTTRGHTRVNAYSRMAVAGDVIPDSYYHGAFWPEVDDYHLRARKLLTPAAIAVGRCLQNPTVEHFQAAVDSLRCGRLEYSSTDRKWHDGAFSSDSLAVVLIHRLGCREFWAVAQSLEDVTDVLTDQLDDAAGDADGRGKITVCLPYVEGEEDEIVPDTIMDMSETERAVYPLTIARTGGLLVVTYEWHFGRHHRPRPAA